MDLVVHIRRWPENLDNQTMSFLSRSPTRQAMLEEADRD